MKKLLILAALAGFLGTQQCLAIIVHVTQTPGYFSDSGGEFTITDPPTDPELLAIYNNYAPVAQVNGGFQTFAIGFSKRSDGSVILPGPNDSVTFTLLGPDPAQYNQAAWLYMMFAEGDPFIDYQTQKPLYDYTPSPPAGNGTRADTAWGLQNAIWYYQGVDTNPAGGSTSDVGSPFFQFVDPPGLEVDLALLTWTDANNVDESMTVLALVGVPDGGATLMLLGLGLSSLGAFSRRFRA